MFSWSHFLHIVYLAAYACTSSAFTLIVSHVLHVVGPESLQAQ